MPGIDYSKWDKFCESHESDGSAEEPQGRPAVTRLQYPSRVTVGPNGVRMETAPPVATVSPFNTREMDPTAAHTSTVPTTPATAASREDPSLAEKACRDNDDDDMMYHNLTRNGGREGQSHLWSQTRDTATVSFIFPSMHTKAKDICNFCLCVEEQSDRSSVCVLTFGVKGVEGERRCVFRYPVRVDDDATAGCWQMHSLHTKSLRLMVVQLVKEPVAVGMSLWWDKCFVTDQTTVDTRKLADRSDAAATRAEEFQRAWEGAHAEFKKRMNERRGRHLIPEADDDDDDDE